MTGVAYRMDIGQSADEPGLPQLDETTVDLAERSADEPVGLLYNQGDIGGGVVAIAKLKHQGGAWVHVMDGIGGGVVDDELTVHSVHFKPVHFAWTIDRNSVVVHGDYSPTTGVPALSLWSAPAI
jgi:hypothetical protein